MKTKLTIVTRNRVRGTLIKLAFLVLYFICSFSAWSQTPSPISFSPIPYSDADILSPGRGVENWNNVPWDNIQGVKIPPGNTATLDAYYRFNWFDFEGATAGVYSWTIFDKMINVAIDNGRKFSFGVMTICDGCSPTIAGGYMGYPQYVHTQMQTEVVKDWLYNGTWVPNWNSNYYLTAFENLLKAINTHIATGSRNGVKYSDVIGYIDIRGYGNFGEWHNWPWYQNQPTGATATSATLKRIIDAHIKGFPSYPLVALVGALDPGNACRTPADVSYYALTATNTWGQIGWRRDNFGDPGYAAILENNTGSYQGVAFKTLIMEKYKFAPVVGEPANDANATSGAGANCMYYDLESEVRKYHAASFGNGNFPDLANACVKDNIIAASKASGYRLILQGGNVTTSVNSGVVTLGVSLDWKNIGVAPTYENWNTTFELRNAAGTAVWSGVSSFKPKLFLPATAATTFADNFNLPTSLASGTYSLYLIVKDPAGYRKPLPLAITGRTADGAYLISSVNVSTTGTVTGNASPTANAGSAQTITLPVDSVKLTGTGTDADGTIATYAWTQASGPVTGAIATPSSAATTIKGLVAGTYTFRLTVTDNKGATGSADVQVTVNAPPLATANSAPFVSAGNAISVTLPASATTLTGTATDSDGTITSYAWTKVSGPAGGAITSPSSATTTVTGLTAGTYIYKLTATDNGGATGSANVTVNVTAKPNIAPTVTAGPSSTITLPTSSASISGTATDLDGTVTSYAWTQVSGPATAVIASASSAATTASAMTVSGSYVFKLTATDNIGATASANVTVTVNTAANKVPTVSAGAAQAITLPVSTVTLTGSANDTDGTIATYAWTMVSGAATATFATPDAASSSVSGLIAAGSYVFKLTVTDNSGATASANVTVTVNLGPNVAPTVNAGTDVSITLPENTTTLSGSGVDIDGTITAYAWTKVSGPTGGTIASPKSAVTNITSLNAGTYVYRLTVTDDRGGTANDNVSVFVNSSPVANQAPSASAGSNITLTLPVNNTTLTGTGSDNDGTISTYAWSQISGPTTGTIDKPANASTSISNLVEGTYTFRLTVTDNSGLTATSDVLVVVHAANQMAVIKFAADTIQVTLPTNNTELNATSSFDPDGTITSYSWTFVNGPSTPGILSPTTAKTTVNSLSAGTYVFNLSVTDDKGAVSNQTEVVVVNYSNTRTSELALAIYPNPVQSSTTVSFNSSLEGKGSYQLTDMSGRPVITGEFTKVSGAQTIKIDMSSLKAGIYFLKLQVNDVRVAVKKLMKL